MTQKELIIKQFADLEINGRIEINDVHYKVLNTYRCIFHNKYLDRRIVIVKSKFNPGVNIIMRAE